MLYNVKNDVNSGRYFKKMRTLKVMTAGVNKEMETALGRACP